MSRVPDTEVDVTVDEELPGRAIDPDLLALIQGVQSLPAGQRPERLEVDLNLGILNVYPNG